MIGLLVIVVPLTNCFDYPWGLPVVAQFDTLAANQRPNRFFRIKPVEPDWKKRRLHRHARKVSAKDRFPEPGPKMLIRFRLSKADQKNKSPRGGRDVCGSERDSSLADSGCF